MGFILHYESNSLYRSTCGRVKNIHSRKSGVKLYQSKKQRKDTKRNRATGFTKGFTEILQKYRNYYRLYLSRKESTGTMLHSTTIYKRLKKLAGQCRGVKKSKVHAHSFRHLFAINIWKNTEILVNWRISRTLILKQHVYTQELPTK